MRPWRSRSLFSYLRVFLIVYGLAYWALMIRDLDSVDSEGQFQFRSSIRYGSRMSMEDGFNTARGKTSFLNYFFYPADFAFYAIKDMLSGDKPWPQ